MLSLLHWPILNQKVVTLYVLIVQNKTGGKTFLSEFYHSLSLLMALHMNVIYKVADPLLTNDE